ncbi:hypothetical protein CH063_12886 [Colletotrichum higginsianum]|uniref:Uncharacterized protein n=1 Tax=Colletotrichum higginsianum (strain IMI 349063) TaxID=759273 RepID=H1VS72_COLHI|nr:hypothetical protein CH063_12886 [Colletotrichum higginsianum]
MSTSCRGLPRGTPQRKCNAVKLFEFLREKKVGDALTKAVFYAGDWSRPAAFMFCKAVDEGAEGAGSKQILCQGIDTKITSSRWESGYDEILDGGDDNDDDYNLAWATDLAKRAKRMELLD